MSGAFLRRRDQTDRPLRVDHYSAAVNTILRGRSDANVRFADLRSLMQHLGFEERIRGSHHLYRKEGVAEKVNLQRDDGDAKPTR